MNLFIQSFCAGIVGFISSLMLLSFYEGERPNGMVHPSEIHPDEKEYQIKATSKAMNKCSFYFGLFAALMWFVWH